MTTDAVDQSCSAGPDTYGANGQSLGLCDSFRQYSPHPSLRQLPLQLAKLRHRPRPVHGLVAPVEQSEQQRREHSGHPAQKGRLVGERKHAHGQRRGQQQAHQHRAEQRAELGVAALDRARAVAGGDARGERSGEGGVVGPVLAQRGELDRLLAGGPQDGHVERPALAFGIAGAHPLKSGDGQAQRRALLAGEFQPCAVEGHAHRAPTSAGAAQAAVAVGAEGLQ